MPRGENSPVPQQDEIGSGQSRLADMYRPSGESLDRQQLKLMKSHFEQQEKKLDKSHGDMTIRFEQLSARLEQDARQPRLAMEADGPSCCQLATKRSSLHSVPQQPFAPNFRSPRAAMYGVASVPPVAPSCSRRRDFFWHGIETGLASKDPANLICENAAARNPAAPARITSPQSNARHDPKTGQARRRPLESPGSNVIFSSDFVSMTFRPEALGRLCPRCVLWENVFPKRNPSNVPFVLKPKARIISPVTQYRSSLETADNPSACVVEI